MRRTVALALAVLAWPAAGCGDERPGIPASAPSVTVSPAPTTASSPSSPPSPLPATGALDGFPLDVGYDGQNGDDHSPVLVTGRPATRAFALCGVPAWDPRRGSTDVLGVEWRGEAEWARGRTLVRYPSVDDAAGAVAATRDALGSCAVEPGAPGYGTAHTVLDQPDQILGEQSVAWTDTYWFESGGDRLFDTGLAVYHLVRVGRTVLLAYEYTEGNGSTESRADGIALATDLELPVVAALDAVGP